MVERDLAKVEVASSNLVSRSKFKGKGERIKEKVFRFHLFPFAFILYPFKSGGVAKW